MKSKNVKNGIRNLYLFQSPAEYFQLYFMRFMLRERKHSIDKTFSNLCKVKYK